MNKVKVKIERFNFLKNELKIISNDLATLKNKLSIIKHRRNEYFIQFGNYCLHNLTEKTFDDKFCFSLMQSIEKLDFSIRDCDKLIYFNELKRETLKREYECIGSELCLI